MATCKVCGNNYAHSFEIVRGGHSATYDCFECAIHDMAPSCAHCQCRVIGHGIAAGVLQDCEDLRERDPQMAGRDALVVLDHPALGAFGHVNTPLRFSRDGFEPFRSPVMGEHSHEIARTICGLSEAEIALLQEQGAFH